MLELKKRAGLADAVQGSPRTSFRPPKTGAGFTLAELLVSVAILLIIAVAVAGDINRTKFQEELSSSARTLAGSLRDLQARALSATGVSTCSAAGGFNRVCETDATGCVGACGAKLPPYAAGVTFTSGNAFYARWAEVDPALYDHRPDLSAREVLDQRSFQAGTAGTAYVTIDDPMTTNAGSVTTAYVTFDRQNGTMRINACGTPNAPACGGNPEPKTLDIVLRHSRTNQTRTVRLHAITGKISLE